MKILVFKRQPREADALIHGYTVVSKLVKEIKYIMNLDNRGTMTQRFRN